MTELKSSIEIFKRRLNWTKERISELEDRSFEIIHSEEWKEKRNENEWRDLCERCDIIKKNNLCVIRGQQEEMEKEKESLFNELMSENFPHLGRDLDTQVH